MPKKKKTLSVSPYRKNLDSEKVASFSAADMAPPPGQLPPNYKELLDNLSEMFSDLDPGVVYMVLSEYDFKVNVAMDYLLELSTAAKGAVVSSSLDSGFDFVAASLDDISQENSTGSKVTERKTSAEENLSLPDGLLTAELDPLIENAFEMYSLNHPQCSPDSVPQFKTLDHSQEICEPLGLVQPSLHFNSDFPAIQNQADSNVLVYSPSVINAEDTSSHLAQVNNAMQCRVGMLVDTAELSADELDRSSIVEKVSGNSVTLHRASDLKGLSCSASKDLETCKDASLQRLQQENSDLQRSMESNTKPSIHADSCLSQPDQFARVSAVPWTTWNPLACEFYPTAGCYSFVTPIAGSPVQWKPFSDRFFVQGVPASPAVSLTPWYSSGIFASNIHRGQLDVRQNTQFHPVSPRSVVQNVKRKKQFSGKVLVLLRGVPGSGKSTLARTLLKENSNGIVLSSDDYFCRDGEYQYDINCLGEAHEWNHLRAKEAFEKMVSPIIIDNTNTEAWEMKPYVAMAMQHRYRVVFQEPDTWWKFKPKELERRNKHGVSKEKIKRMLDRYERCVTVHTILGSSVPDQLEQDFSQLQDQDEEGAGGNTSHGETHMKEENLLTSSLTCHQTAEEGESVLMMSPSPLKNVLDFSTSDSEKEKKEMEIGIVDYSSDNSSILSTTSVSVVDSANKSAYLESHDVTKEITESENTEKGSKGKVVISGNTEILSVSSTGEMEEVNDMGPKENQTDCDWCSKVPTESETIDESKFSTLVSSLNFVGDWPIEQSMGQRVLRNKRAQQFSSMQSCNEEKSSISYPLESNEMAREDFNVCLDDDLRNVLENKAQSHSERQEDRSFASEFPSHNLLESAKTEVNILAAWPSTLEQKPQRSRRPQKHSLNDGKTEIGINEQVDICELQTVDMFQGASGVHGELQGNITSICHDDGASTIETKEMKYKQNRRVCKLALTFMNNSVSGTPADLLFAINTQESNPEWDLCKGINQYSQTEPQEFALVWRIEKQKAILTESTKVLSGKADQFKPKDFELIMDLDSQGKIPYRVVHDKSTYVEESELDSVDEMANLKILCKLFRSVSFDTLEELYERCNKDIVWATNLLLDSGEKLFKDDEDDYDQGVCKNVNVGPFSTEAELKASTNPEKDDLKWEQTRKEPDDFVQHFENRALSFCESERKITCAKPEVCAELYDAAASLPLSTYVQEAEYGNDILHNANGRQFEVDCIKQPLSLVAQPKPINDLSADYVIQVINQPLVTVSDIETLDDANPSLLEEENASELETGDVSSMDNKLSPVLETSQETENTNLEDANSFEENKHTLEFLTIGVGGGEVEKCMAPQKEDEAKILSGKLASSDSLEFDCLELSLSFELASQLSELFGPVGIDPGSLTGEDCVVYMDLNLAQTIHKKWKESIMERQRREALSYQLILEDWSLSEQSQLDDSEVSSFLQGTEGELLSKNADWKSRPPAPASTGSCKVFSEQSELKEGLPFMDHWNTQTPQVSLRQIMSEEIAFQEHQDLRRVPVWLKKDCATKLKEKQLQEMYPNLDQRLLVEIFRDNNYSLEMTQQLLEFVLEADPVQNVVAQKPAYQSEKTREKTKKGKVEEDILTARDFQDIETPDYEDLRAEALLHRKKQLECFRKAAEAHQRGLMGAATFYAQQGHLHGRKLKEANTQAAEQIFEKLNESLLSENVLDLHGLHVEEALKHLRHVLKQKSEEYKHTASKPYLSVITGRGNHSQGGVARIRPAVTDYLTNHSFRFTEPKPGVLQVTLK
uniref:NEDD4-binding protein 2 isoform X2 n=1 Tax=Geotrypetes seraphini TaxID=260995 RepID=A0A6P8RJ42_GEOSA|nr:NEDD4-binding protein 2 isoform X2 [Geotrypetes seraphini]